MIHENNKYSQRNGAVSVIFVVFLRIFENDNRQFVYFIEDTCAKNTYFYEYATLDHVRLQQIPIYSNQS